MRDLFKKILGRTEPERVTLAFDAVPAWLDQREQAARETLAAEAAEPIRNIRNAIAGLQLVVNGIAGAEHDPEIHPRLKTIAKNSLPQFLRAMNLALSRELPDDPVEFYPEAAELLKGCINGARGQGRYLVAVLPAEMKDVRLGIDAIGREINGLNPVLSAYRKETGAIAAARELFKTVAAMKEDYARSRGKEDRIRSRIGEISDRIAAIGKEAEALRTDPGMNDVDEKRAILATLGQKRDEAARLYSSLSMTASHVFRKAEKIATRQRHPAEIHALATAMDMLSHHEIPGRDQLTDVLAAACPIAARMIEAGEISLKNKEERTIFADVPGFCAGIGEVSSALRELEEQYRAGEAVLAAHPVLVKLQSLERERMQLETMLGKETASLDELGEWRKSTAVQIPRLTGELAEKIKGMGGDYVQLTGTEDLPA